jgi:hypothetical protein
VVAVVSSMHLATTPKREHLTRAEAAAYLSIAPRTLSRWAASTPPRGPRYSRSGNVRGRVWYSIDELDKWLEDRKVPTPQGST